MKLMELGQSIVVSGFTEIQGMFPCCYIGSSKWFIIATLLCNVNDNDVLKILTLCATIMF